MHIFKSEFVYLCLCVKNRHTKSLPDSIFAFLSTAHLCFGMTYQPTHTKTHTTTPTPLLSILHHGSTSGCQTINLNGLLPGRYKEISDPGLIVRDEKSLVLKNIRSHCLEEINPISKGLCSHGLSSSLYSSELCFKSP